MQFYRQPRQNQSKLGQTYKSIMITQFPIMSLLSQSTELRNEAMLVHLRNMEHPDAYLSFVFQVLCKISDHVEIQLSLQIISQLVGTARLSVECVTRLAQHFVAQHVERGIVRYKDGPLKGMQKMVTHIVDQCMKELCKMSNCKQNIEQSKQQQSKMIARRVLEDMTMGLVALSSLGAHRVSAMEMLVIILENCSQGEWRLQASQLLVQNRFSVLKKMPKGPLYDSHIAALLVHALNINKIVELDLVIDSFWFSPTIAAKYLSELAADNYLSYKQQSLILQFLFDKVLSPNHVHLEEEAVKDICSLLKLLLKHYHQRQFCQLLLYDSLIVKDQSQQLTELTLNPSHITKLVKWIVKMLKEHWLIMEVAEELVDVVQPIIESTYREDALISKIVNVLEELIFSKENSIVDQKESLIVEEVDLSNLKQIVFPGLQIVNTAKELAIGLTNQHQSCSFYFLASYYLPLHEYFSDLKQLLKTCVTNLKEVRQTEVEGQTYFLLFILKYFENRRPKEQLFAKHLFQEISQLLPQLKAEALSIAVRICLTRSCHPDIKEEQLSATNMQQFSHTIWSIIASQQVCDQVVILREICRAIEKQGHCELSFLEDLICMISENEIVFNDFYLGLQLAVRTQYLLLIGCCIENCEVMEKCIVVVMGFLERFKLATIVEGLELERLLAIYRSIINFYNKYAVYDQDGLIDSSKSLVTHTMNLLTVPTLLTHQKLVYEMLAMEDDRITGTRVKDMQRMLISKMVQRIDEDCCDLLEVASMFFPVTMKKYHGKILETVRKTPHYYRFCFLLRPDPYPALPVLQVPLTETKHYVWAALARLAIQDGQPMYPHSKQTDKRAICSSQQPIIETLRKLTLNDHKPTTSPMLLKLAGCLEQCTALKHHWISNAKGTTVEPVLAKMLKSQYKVSKVLKAIDCRLGNQNKMINEHKKTKEGKVSKQHKMRDEDKQHKESKPSKQLTAKQQVKGDKEDKMRDEH